MATQAMSDLSLNPPTKAKVKAKKAAPVVDSWEDEDVDSDPEPDQSASPTSPPLEKDSNLDGSGFAAPPPTPSSPSYSASGVPPWQSISSSITGGSPSSLSPVGEAGGDNGGARRPEKTDAVARRMIASALGVRAPRATEEQRAYDRAVREKERKRREEEREAEKRRKEEAEKAKAAIWND
ncbi:hypothetical protein GGS26DRAFT_546287 [Hypomontagnella submonticulosa]|nr:hypothetical protein GGS26DRAFT_546287 [Hypomontagnella submonticulosa]